MLKIMYITVKKQFFIGNDGVDYACAIDVEEDITVHESWDNAFDYHKLFYKKTFENYESFIINHPVIEDHRNGGSIITKFVFRTGNGTIYRTVLETVEKVCE